jgi:hypothetical protein
VVNQAIARCEQAFLRHVVAALRATLTRTVLAANVAVTDGRSGADIVEIAGAAATGRTVVAADVRSTRTVVVASRWSDGAGKLAAWAERAIAAIEAETAATDLIVTAGGVVVRRYAFTGGRVACLALAATRFGACLDAFAGIGVLMLTVRALDRLTDAAAFPVVECLVRWALIVDAALLAADLARAAGRAILLPEARIAGAGVRVSLLPFFTRIVTDALTAPFVSAATTLLTDGAAIARLFLGTLVCLGTGLGLRHGGVVDVGICLAARAHVAVEIAATGVRLGARSSQI